jgi:hypothetical protein
VTQAIWRQAFAQEGFPEGAPVEGEVALAGGGEGEDDEGVF